MIKKIKIYTLIFFVNIVGITSVIFGTNLQKLRNEQNSLNKQFMNCVNELNNLKNKSKNINKSIIETEKQLKEIKKKQKLYGDIIRKKLKIIYEGSNSDNLISVLECKNIAELINSMEYLSLINKFDKSLLDNFIRQRKKIEDINNNLKIERINISKIIEIQQKKEIQIVKLIEKNRGEIRQSTINTFIKQNYSSGNNVNGNDIVSRARSKIGKIKYKYGGTSSTACDCSAFVEYCLTGSFGRKKGWTTVSFDKLFKKITNPMPGDICVTPDKWGRSAHCGIYVGGGKMIHCCSSRKGGVVESPVHKGMVYRRY